MRMAHLFGRTLRDAPGDAELPSHQLLLRGAFVRPLGSGIFSLLPLGWRVVRKVEQIIREEMDAIGGQELYMPVVHPADLWRESGRYRDVGPELTRFQDRAERDMVLAMTHEEIVTDLARSEISSYRQLPMLVYHIQTKWRDEPRARGGLIRVREFTMKDSYSLDRDEAGLGVQYEAHWRAYERIFRRCGLKFVVVGADTGMMGGKSSHEFMALSPHGEDIILLCPNGDYAANREVAEFRRDAPPAEDALPMEEVETPNTTTIEALAKILDVPLARTAKAVFFKGGSGRFVFVVIRGDLEVNETKLRKVTDELTLVPATVEEIRAVGAEPGYGSPVGVQDAYIVADESVRDSPNLVAGANRVGYHVRNVNLGRDYQADIVADIAAAADGHPCPKCGAPFVAERAIEVGNIFWLGTRFSAAMGATYQDEQGESHPIQMGSYGIGSGRAVATVVEQHHDAKGIAWPVTIAPFHVSLLALGKTGDAETVAAADALCADLEAAGIEVLYDDREERPGVKFNDADLIGCPVRLSVSPRTLANGQAELKARTATEATFVPLGEAVAAVTAMLDALRAELSGEPDAADRAW
ncbi:MAG: Prolyl-tRNA synthetase, bacterial type [uncultured Thermomicrobiales bacterium]|uniref:Proline--tRNA ligase n=1 Tax=uncultured Thermomicrobiales bacterium TaxID=1645740 RepID=A0A6J4UBQ9_9BACT|nr:MAG: Prolyl-tRNA synthetase, bacterial type [uncultured Thermomicrobiales bacterium]